MLTPVTSMESHSICFRQLWTPARPKAPAGNLPQSAPYPAHKLLTRFGTMSVKLLLGPVAAMLLLM